MIRSLPRRRALAAAALACCLALVAAACGGSNSSGTSASSKNADGKAATKTQKVTLVLDWTPNTNHGGIYLAAAKGYYQAAGLDVDIIQPDQNGAVPQMVAGNADFAISYAEGVIPARAEGVPVVSLGAIIAHNTSSLVAPADRGITRPKDLEGKTYGGFGGELENALVKELVRCDGGDPSKVRFVEVGNVDYRVGFDNKAFDFVWVFDGWDVINIRDIGGQALTTLPFAKYSSCIPDWYTPLIATTEKTIKDRPDLVRKFMAATTKGYQDAMADPAAAAAALLAAAPESSKDLVTRSAQYLASRYAPDPKSWGHQDPKVWSNFEAWLRGQGITKDQVDTTKAFTNDFLPSA